MAQESVLLFDNGNWRNYVRFTILEDGNVEIETEHETGMSTCHIRTKEQAREIYRNYRRNGYQPNV